MEELRINKVGNLESSTHRQCTYCGTIFEKRKLGCRMKICKPCNSLRVKSQSQEALIWRRAKVRAKKQNVPFTIFVDDIVIPEFCPILGMKLVVHKGTSGAWPDSPSLDKIVPELGYVKGNIQVISSLANSMKFTATPEQMLLFAKWVVSTYS